MSLFQAREWWSVRGNPGAHCCVICNIDNEPGVGPGLNKIVIGSLDGMLRMYYPRRRDYKVDDLILEKMLDAPILQLGYGKFVSGSRELCLSVLHPRRLVVFLVSAVSSGGAVNYYNVMEAYAHELARPSYNMCHGSFSGVHGRDYTCIQSLDAVLSFFEQDAPAFRRALPPSQFLVPGPLMYIARSDTFVVPDCCMVLHAYRYSVLAAATDNVNDGAYDSNVVTGATSRDQSQRPGGAQAATGKKVQVDWSLNLGEHPQHLFFAKMMRAISAQESIVVVGERHLYYLKEHGEVHAQKRIDDDIACAAIYAVVESTGSSRAGGDQGYHNLILGTHSGHLHILRETQVIWCAQLNHVPILVQISEIGGTKGMITTLDEDGLLQVSYLGTDPPPAQIVNTEMKEINYAAMEAEHQQLLATIRESHGEGRKEPSDKMTITAQVDPQIRLVDDNEEVDDIAMLDGFAVEGSLRLVANLQGAEAAEKLTFSLQVPPCFVPSQKLFFFSKMRKSSGSGTPLLIPITFKILANVLCSSLTARATCTYYVGSNQEPRCTTCEFELPLSWAVRVVPPIKTANYKIQFDTARTPPPLTEVFSNVFDHPQGGQSNASANVLSLQYLAGTNFSVTILVSKSAGRVCVQSSEFGALYLICNELCERLSHHHCEVSFQDSLPLHDYFSVLDDHFSVRRHLAALRQDLADRTHQYRVAQKRILGRFKDRNNPTSLNNLDALLTLTYETIAQLADSIEEADRAMSVVSQHLCACTRLILLLIQYRFDLRDGVDLLRCYFTFLTDSIHQGWEELCDVNLDYMLKSTLTHKLNEKKEPFVGLGGNTLQIPHDLGKLKKRITTVIDRLANGVRFEPSSYNNEAEEDEA